MNEDEVADPAATGGRQARQRPEETAERRLTGWQRALRWVAWLAFLGLAVWNSQRVMFSGVEWLALAAAVGITIWCMAKPLGGPKVDLSEPTHLLGEFLSRTSWGLVLLSTLLTIGGVAGAGAAVYDMATGRATVGDVVHHIAIFVEGWIVELIGGIAIDAELEKTHAYALFVLLIPGLIMLWINLIPLTARGTPFRVEQDGSVFFRHGDTWEPMLEYQYRKVIADGTRISFWPGPDDPPAVTFPQYRVFSRDFGVRLPPKVSAEFFRVLLRGRGFTVDDSAGPSFTADRDA